MTTTVLTGVPVQEAKAVPIDAKALIRVGAPPSEPNVTSPCLVRDAETGEDVVLTLRYAGDLAAFRQAARGYAMSSVIRAAGIRNRAATVGFTARNQVMQRASCRQCRGSIETPAAHDALCAACPVLAGQLAEVLPERAAHDAEVAEAVLPEWRILGTQWSSGVLNETSPLPYHFDRNNLPAWSAMLVARRGMKGGHLHVPGYDLTLDCRDGDVVLFAGWRHMHGVTPLVKTARDGYRYSAVFYAVSRMAHCLPFDQELEQGRASRSASEDDPRGPDSAFAKIGARPTTS